jgi:hypothetical protein
MSETVKLPCAAETICQNLINTPLLYDKIAGCYVEDPFKDDGSLDSHIDVDSILRQYACVQLDMSDYLGEGSLGMYDWSKFESRMDRARMETLFPVLARQIWHDKLIRETSQQAITKITFEGHGQYLQHEDAAGFTLDEIAGAVRDMFAGKFRYHKRFRDCGCVRFGLKFSTTDLHAVIIYVGCDT